MIKLIITLSLLKMNQAKVQPKKSKSQNIKKPKKLTKKQELQNNITCQINKAKEEHMERMQKYHAKIANAKNIEDTENINLSVFNTPEKSYTSTIVPTYDEWRGLSQFSSFTTLPTPPTPPPPPPPPSSSPNTKMVIKGNSKVVIIPPPFEM
jgi:hypothetical protein